MTTQTAQEIRTAAPVVDAMPKRRRFDVWEYHAMGKAGILKDGERVELIDGDILSMAPIGSEHVSSVNVSTLALIRRIGDNAFVSIQAPVRLDDNTEPEPDIALLRWRDDFYRSRLPISEDALLLIEAADTSLAYDRGEKLAMYACHGIPEVWISNLRDRVIEAHSEPVDGVYAKSRVYRPGETISPACLPDVEIPVRLIVGDARDDS